MLTLVIPVYRNEESIPDLLNEVSKLDRKLNKQLEVVLVVDGSPDKSYELLRTELPKQSFRSKLILLSKNFGSFAAIRAGLEHGTGSRFAVMAADLQEPPELVLQMDHALQSEPIDVVVGVRESREDPPLTKFFSRIFWGLYKRYVVPEIPPGGVDVFGCNKEFRDRLLELDERHSSLVAQLFWLGFRRKTIGYDRRQREHGSSAWTFKKKLNYLSDSIFAFTDLPIKLLIRLGAIGASLSAVIGILALLGKLLGLISVPGYAMTIISITLLGTLNLLGLGIVGSYAWRTYENTKGRPIAVSMVVDNYEGEIEDEQALHPLACDM